MGQYDVSYGSKYESTKNMSRVEIAKLIRADIKAGVKAGTLPKAKYSVTCSRGTGIDVEVSNVEEAGFLLHNPERLRWESENPHSSVYSAPANVRRRFSDRAEGLIEQLEAIWKSYNYDGSDLQTDYFNVRYYGSVQFGWQWADKMREVEDLRTGGDVLVQVLTASPVTAQADWLDAMGAL